MKLYLKQLGEVELRNISLGTLKTILNLNAQKDVGDKFFAISVLYGQLVTPKCDLQQFSQLADTDLQMLAKELMEKSQIAIYFKDSGDYYKDLRSALKAYTEEQLNKLSDILKPNIQAIQEAFAKLVGQIKVPHAYFKELAASIVQSYQIDINKMINELVKPIVDSFRQWQESNRTIFEDFNRFWQEFHSKYSIAEGKATNVLRKYKWFITPSFPVSFLFEIMELDKKKGRQDKAINKLFIDYFAENNWENLGAMVASWDYNPLLKKRIKVLSDCVRILKKISDRRINETNVILPTLIAQIDGTLTDYLILKKIPFDCDYDDLIDKGSGKLRKRGRKSQFKKSKPIILPKSLDDVTTEIFLDILFQRSQRGKVLGTPFNYNRHKIIHGENVTYGRKSYMIRAFMTLDFLAHLK